MTVLSLYRRVLPSPPAIDFSSDEGKKLFFEAIQGGAMEGFYKLISNFQTQSEPAYCGLASLSMVLNSLAIDPQISWKGPWRWFDETMLDCYESLEKVKIEGVSFGKVVCLAQCAGAEVQAYRTTETTLDQFRQLVQSCSASDVCHIISSYNRETFKQTGTGHFSPIGGYHAGRDMVLILDVARFKYPPHWVSLTLLWEAMDTIDLQTGRKRGFMMISRPQVERGLQYALSFKNKSWADVAKYLVDDVPSLLESRNIKDMNKLIGLICEYLPPDFENFVHWIVEAGKADDEMSTSTEEQRRVDVKEEVLRQVRGTNLHSVVMKVFSSISCTRLHSSEEENPQNFVPSIGCRGDETEILTDIISSLICAICQESCSNCIHANNNSNKSHASFRETSESCQDEENAGMLFPEHTDFNSSRNCACINSQPAWSAVLTVLLFALPRETWSLAHYVKLQDEIHELLATENLSPLLQEEVMHLRRLLYLMKKCWDDRTDEDFLTPTL